MFKRHKTTLPAPSEVAPVVQPVEISRRKILALAGGAGAAALLAACNNKLSNGKLVVTSEAPTVPLPPRTTERERTPTSTTTPATSSTSLAPSTTESSTTEAATTTEAPSTTAAPETTVIPKPEMKKPAIGMRMSGMEIDTLPWEGGSLIAGVYGGIDETTINHMDFVSPSTGQKEPVVGFDTRSDVPGTVGAYGGKSVYFAHRNSHDHPMRHINELLPGALMTLPYKDESGADQTQQWVMNKPFEVYDEHDKTLSKILGPGDGTPQIVMFACSNMDGQGSYGVEDPAGKYGIKNGTYTAAARIVTYWEQAPAA